MPYLRTNYRLTGKEIDPDAIGGIGTIIEQVLTGANIANQRYFGGLGFASWTYDRPPTTTGVIPISAYGVMCQTYGPTVTSGVFGSGFKFYPAFVLYDSVYLGAGTISCYKYVKLPCSVWSGSICMLRVFAGSVESAPTSLISTESIGFRLFGFIMSSPWS